LFIKIPSLHAGTIVEDIIKVPLYLSQMRLSVVTGIKGAREDKWVKFLEELESASSHFEYDLQFGNAGEWISLVFTLSV